MARTLFGSRWALWRSLLNRNFTLSIDRSLGDIDELEKMIIPYEAELQVNRRG